MGKDEYELMCLADTYASEKYTDGAQYGQMCNSTLLARAALESAITSALAEAHAAGRRDGLEACASVCEEKSKLAISVLSPVTGQGKDAQESSNLHLRMMSMYAADCAKSIRALIDSPTTKHAPPAGTETLLATDKF